MKIPLFLITGFLGSGKTTYLRHLSRTLKDRRILFLVNEFSTIDVDGAILRELGPDTLSVPGGSIFCRCLVTDFIATLDTIAETHLNAANALKGVIIEASGIANPKVINDLLEETKQNERYELRSVVSVADPGSLHKLLQTLPNIKAQLEAADIILINKCDLFDEETLTATEAAIRAINPSAALERTVNAEASADLLAQQADHEALHGEYAKCADPNYGTLAIRFPAPVDLNAFLAAFAETAGQIYRAKGFIPTNQGTVLFNHSTAETRTDPTSRSDVELELALITTGAHAASAQRLARQAEEGEFSA